MSEEIIATLLTLKHPTRPAQELPLPLRKLLPDPIHGYDDHQRFVHADIEGMTAAARRAESFRLKVAVAQVESDQVPDYIIERIARLDAA